MRRAVPARNPSRPRGRAPQHVDVGVTVVGVVCPVAVADLEVDGRLCRSVDELVAILRSGGEARAAAPHGERPRRRRPGWRFAPRLERGLLLLPVAVLPRPFGPGQLRHA